MTSLIPLAFLLAILGAPSGSWASNVSVSFQQDGPDGIYGVACHSDFRAVEGNAQALCSGMPDDSMVLFESAWESRGRLLNVLAHESAHLQLGVNHVGRTAYERFREYEAYEFGCAYQYIPECKRWLR